MRIIHTADWHLCNRLGRIDRTDDLKARVEKVAALCEERAADLLLIAGDLFSEQATVEQMTDALRHLHRTFAPFFARGGAVVAITGNHDRDRRIDLIRAGMSLVAPPSAMGSRLAPGRFYLLNGLFQCVFEPSPGEAVQLVLIPYPFPCRYDLPAEFRTKEEENRLLHGCVADWVHKAPDRAGFDPRLPTVLAAHLHIRGSELHSLYQLTEREDVLFDFADLNPGWAYAALGHIHKPQTINGMPNVRYCGSLDRLDFGETHQEHGVLFLEVGRTGLKGDPERLPIPATPFHTIQITDPAVELLRLRDDFPSRQTAVVRISVSPFAAGPSRDELARELRGLFPRLYELKWEETPREGAADTATLYNPRAGFAATVRDYLTARLADDLDKEGVLALADTFLADGGEA